MSRGVFFWKKETSDGTVSNCGMTEGHDLGLGMSEGLQEKCEGTRPEERAGVGCERCMAGDHFPHGLR